MLLRGSLFVRFLLQPRWTTGVFWLLIVLRRIFAIHRYGRSLGVDAVIPARATMPGHSLKGSSPPPS
jgi:hypothetical protein